MTRKDYVLIAAKLREARITLHGTGTDTESRKAAYNSGCDNAAHRVADALEQDNPRFDRARFLVACAVRS